MSTALTHGRVGELARVALALTAWSERWIPDAFIFAARHVETPRGRRRQQKRGHIINVGSLSGLSPIPFLGIYSASKFALEGYTEALRHEVKPFNIHVSLTEAGFLKTPMMSHQQAAGNRVPSMTDGGNELSLQYADMKRRGLALRRWLKRCLVAKCFPTSECRRFPKRWAHVVGAARVHPHKH
jgi:short-subunit dehydrogenase